jgi:hypothetical protein
MSKFLRKNIIFVVMATNNHKLNDYTEDCYYASNIPCKLESGDISKLLLNNVPVNGDFFQMTEKTLQLIKHFNQSNDIDVDFDKVLIKIIATQYSYENALVLASMYPNNKKEIILPTLFTQIYYNYKNIIVKCDCTDSKLLNDTKKEDLNNLIDKCYFKRCHDYSSKIDCENCISVKSQFTLLSQYMISDTLYTHHCKNDDCFNVLKKSRETKKITDMIENFEINININGAKRIEADENSRRLLRRNIASKFGISPKSWFVDLKINELMNSVELGNCKKTLINELFANRMSTMPWYFSNVYLCDFNLKPSLIKNKLHYFNVSNDNYEYIDGKIGKIFHLCHIDELFIAAKVFLREINKALDESLVMSDIIIFGGSILSVMSGTNVIDYDIRLKKKLTCNEMFLFIKALSVRYSDYPLYVDKIECPTKLIIKIHDRTYDFSNSDKANMISDKYPTHIYLEFNEKVVQKIICNEQTLKLMENGTISFSNFFSSDEKISKYLRKGFILEGLEHDLELEYEVSKILLQNINIKKKQNLLISVKFQDGNLVTNQQFVNHQIDHFNKKYFR